MRSHRVLLPLVALLASAASTLLAGCASLKPAGAIARTRPVLESQAAATESDVVMQARQVFLRTASIDVTVHDPTLSSRRAHAMMQTLGGRVERESQTDRASTIVYRVPERFLDAALDSLAGLGRVSHRVASSEDATSRAIDMEARLQNLEASRDRLRVLHERAATVSDVLAVEHELARVQGEIDSVRGQLEDIRGRAAMSDVQLTIRRRVVLGPLGLLVGGVAWTIGKLFVIR